MIVRIWEVKRVACYVMLRLKLLHKAVASVAYPTDYSQTIFGPNPNNHTPIALALILPVAI